jgi:hypothetical protein
MTNWKDFWEGGDEDRHYLVEPRVRRLPSGAWSAEAGPLSIEDTSPEVALARILRQIANQLEEPDLLSLGSRLTESQP